MLFTGTLISASLFGSIFETLLAGAWSCWASFKSCKWSTCAQSSHSPKLPHEQAQDYYCLAKSKFQVECRLGPLLTHVSGFQLVLTAELAKAWSLYKSKLNLWCVYFWLEWKPIEWNSPLTIWEETQLMECQNYRLDWPMPMLRQ